MESPNAMIWVNGGVLRAATATTEARQGSNMMHRTIGGKEMVVAGRTSASRESSKVNKGSTRQFVPAVLGALPRRSIVPGRHLHGLQHTSVGNPARLSTGRRRQHAPPFVP
jgi:hypothetical protein